MSATSGKGRLAGATKELALKWAETKNYWRDEKSAEFERKYLRIAEHERAGKRRRVTDLPHICRLSSFGFDRS
jgi:hypothetical protein